MRKDIGLGLDLAEKYAVPQRIHRLVADVYDESIQRYGADSGSTIPVRLCEDDSNVTLSEGAGSAKRAFRDWTYTTEIQDGAFQVIPKGIENPYK